MKYVCVRSFHTAMQRSCLLALFVVAPLFAADRGQAARPVAAELQVELPTYHALIVGINDYANWPKLRRASEDAQALAKVLQGRYGFTDVRLLIDEQATREALVEALESLLNLEQKSSLLIFFAGHGDMNPKLNEGYWIPQDARRGAVATYLPNSDVEKYIAAIKARHVLVIADACFSGALLRGEEAKLPDTLDMAWYRRTIAKPSRYVITSGDLESVPDQSVFCTKLLNYLEYSETDVFSAREIAMKLEKDVPRFTRQMVLSGPLRNDPMDENGQFVFVRVAKAESRAGAAQPSKLVRPDPTQAPPIGSQGEREKEEAALAVWAGGTKAGPDSGKENGVNSSVATQGHFGTALGDIFCSGQVVLASNGRFGGAMQGWASVGIKDHHFDDERGTMEAFVYKAQATNEISTEWMIFRVGDEQNGHNVDTRNDKTAQTRYLVYQTFVNGQKNEIICKEPWWNRKPGWHHLMVTWDAAANKAELFLDGKSVGTAPYMKTACSGAPWFSVRGDSTNDPNCFGPIDEVRVSRVVRKPTVPTRPYQADDDTLVLLHFDGAIGQPSP